MNHRLRSLTAFVITSVSFVTVGCTMQPSEPEAAPPQIQHVHGIAKDPRGDNLLIATHGGIFTVSATGEVAGPIGGQDFDAMGFMVVSDTLWASGHPGEQTSSALGTPNLGVIRSDDFGATWAPVALTDTTDFHALTASPDGTFYGVAPSESEVLRSTEGGKEWTRGASLPAVDLVATYDGLYAATETGLMFSADQGATFSLLADAPLLYTLDAQPDGALAGAGTDGTLWVQGTDGAWESRDSFQGTVQAFSVLDTNRFAFVDDRGVVEITAGKATVLAPAR